MLAVWNLAPTMQDRVKKVVHCVWLVLEPVPHVVPAWHLDAAVPLHPETASTVQCETE